MNHPNNAPVFPNGSTPPAEFNCQVSLYKHIKEVIDGHEVDLLAIFEGIRAGQWRAYAEATRAIADSKVRQAFKKQVPYYTASGTFTVRNIEGLKTHSGVICIDIDHDTTKRKHLEEDPYTLAAHLSISGNGLAVYIKIDPQHHEASFRWLEKYYRDQYGVTIDKSCKNVDRARFISYDPDLFINQGSKPLAAADLATMAGAQPAGQAQPPQAAPAGGRQAEYGQTILARAVDLVLRAADGEKHRNLNTAGFLLGGYVATGFLGQAEAEQALQGAIRQKANVSSLEDADKVIARSIREGMAKPILPNEVEMYVRVQRREGWGVDTVLPIVAAMNGVAADVLRPAIDQIYREQEVKLEKFWDVKHDEQKDKTTIRISKPKFLDFLNESGFWQYLNQVGSQIVRVESGAAEVVDLPLVKRFLIDYLEALPFEFDGIFRIALIDTYLTESPRLCKMDFLENLPVLDAPFVRADKDTAFFYYKNGFAAVSKSQIDFKQYNQLPGLIWRQQVLNREFTIIDSDQITEGCEFYRFCFNLTGHHMERLEVLIHSLGYLLHQHRSRTNYAAIILCDQGGRTGKGIIGQAMSHMKRVARIDGRNVDLNRPFALQRVTNETEVIMIDDADPKRIPFERIFTWLTEGLEIEYKNKSSFEIPFEHAPKFLITSNFVFDGATASHEGRKVEIEFEPYYKIDFTPADDFGHELFSGWDALQWQLFDNFMVLCCQLYLANGLRRYKSDSLQRKKAIQSTCEEFVTWAEENLAGLTIGSEVNKKDAYHEFSTLAGFTDKTLTQRKFTTWVKDYLKHHGFVFEDKQRRSSVIVEELLVIIAMPPEPPDG